MPMFLSRREGDYCDQCFDEDEACPCDRCGTEVMMNERKAFVGDVLCLDCYTK